MIRELAEFEHELESVTVTEADLLRNGFGPNRKFRALMAEWEGQTAGYAVFFAHFSTWVGAELFLEDLFVRERFRGKGIGRALLAAVARTAAQEDFRAMRWEVLSWNEKAIKIYQALGAEFRDGWRSVRLADDALRQLAESKS